MEDNKSTGAEYSNGQKAQNGGGRCRCGCECGDGGGDGTLQEPQATEGAREGGREGGREGEDRDRVTTLAVATAGAG